MSSLIPAQGSTFSCERVRRIEYVRLRKLGWRSKEAFFAAKISSYWEMLDGEILDEYEKPDGCTVVLRVVEDSLSDLEYLKGDMFNPKYIPDISPSKLEREEKEFEEKVEREGVWGIRSEFWNGENWEIADDVYGFVGDSWKDSMYDSDVKHAAIEKYYEALNSVCPTCGRPKRTGGPK